MGHVNQLRLYLRAKLRRVAPSSERQAPNRRSFVKDLPALIAALQLTSQLTAATNPGRVPADDAATSRYRSLNSTESVFTEMLVKTLCPADQFTPDGVNCGLAGFIDRDLENENGSKLDAPDPFALTRESFYKAGVSAANLACKDRFGAEFTALTRSEANEFLCEIGTGRFDSRFPLSTWRNEVVHDLLIRAAFSGPIYDRYSNRVFWKVFGWTEQYSASNGGS